MSLQRVSAPQIRETLTGLGTGILAQTPSKPNRHGHLQLFGFSLVHEGTHTGALPLWRLFNEGATLEPYSGCKALEHGSFQQSQDEEGEFLCVKGILCV